MTASRATRFCVVIYTETLTEGGGGRREEGKEVGEGSRGKREGQ
jgi:hypothetical protein